MDVPKASLKVTPLELTRTVMFGFDGVITMSNTSRVRSSGTLKTRSNVPTGVEPSVVTRYMPLNCSVMPAEVLNFWDWIAGLAGRLRSRRVTAWEPARSVGSEEHTSELQSLRHLVC